MQTKSIVSSAALGTPGSADLMGEAYPPTAADYAQAAARDAQMASDRRGRQIELLLRTLVHHGFLSEAEANNVRNLG